MKIVVLAGGLSPERNVSLSSGAMVCEALRSKGHQVALVDLFFGMEGTDQTVDPFQAPIPQAVSYTHLDVYKRQFPRYILLIFTQRRSVMDCLPS